MTADQHTSVIKTPRQLVVVVTLAFVVPILAILLLVKFVVVSGNDAAGTASLTPEAIAERLRPVASVSFAESGGARTLLTGEAVYNASCQACHATGLAGSPKFGDAGQWAPRIKQGLDTLIKHALEGYKGMPAKGGNADLDPKEVTSAIVFMGNKAGAKFKEP